MKTFFYGVLLVLCSFSAAGGIQAAYALSLYGRWWVFPVYVFAGIISVACVIGGIVLFVRVAEGGSHD